jgi:hypothetical protein
MFKNWMQWFLQRNENHPTLVFIIDTLSPSDIFLINLMMFPCKIYVIIWYQVGHLRILHQLFL